MTQETPQMELGGNLWSKISHTGMNNTGIKGLHGKEICDIIKACARAGVVELTFGDLVVNFGSTHKPEGTTAKDEGTHFNQLELGTTPEQKEQEQIDILQKRAIEDLAQAQTLIDSPSQFEEDLVDSMIYGKEDTQ